MPAGVCTPEESIAGVVVGAVNDVFCLKCCFCGSNFASAEVVAVRACTHKPLAQIRRLSVCSNAQTNLMHFVHTSTTYGIPDKVAKESLSPFKNQSSTSSFHVGLVTLATRQKWLKIKGLWSKIPAPSALSSHFRPIWTDPSPAGQKKSQSLRKTNQSPGGGGRTHLKNGMVWSFGALLGVFFLFGSPIPGFLCSGVHKNWHESWD